MEQNNRLHNAVGKLAHTGVNGTPTMQNHLATSVLST